MLCLCVKKTHFNISLTFDNNCLGILFWFKARFFFKCIIRSFRNELKDQNKGHENVKVNIIRFRKSSLPFFMDGMTYIKSMNFVFR